MRWTPLFWILLFYATFTPTCSEISRQKRSLSFIKKNLVSNVMGSTQKQCKGKFTHRKPSKGYEIFVVPNRQEVVESVPVIMRQPPNYNNNSFFLNSIRQFLTSDAFQETSEIFREIISAIGTSTFQEEDRITEDVTEQSTRRLFQNIPRINQKSVPAIELSKLPVHNEMIYGKPQMPSVLPVVRIVSPMIEVPRKYSYEQIKGKTVEKFTLDKNSDVIVSETKKTTPHPAHIHDRIRGMISSIPLSINPVDLDDLNIHNQQLKHVPKSTLDYASIPYRNIIIMNDRNLNRSLNLAITDQKNSLENSESANDDIGDRLKQRLFEPNKALLQQNNNSQFWNLIMSSDIISRQPQNLNFKPTNSPNDYVNVPSRKVESPLANIFNNDIVAVDNMKTHYMYKQETDSGTSKYEGTSNVTVDQPRDKSDFKKPLRDNMSVYTGRPIIVTSLDGSSENTDSFKLTHDNKIYHRLEKNVKDKPRGDIPDLR